jgi:hypothetical protein
VAIAQPPEPVTVPAGGAITVETEHGFHGQQIEHGQASVTLTAINEIEGVAVCTGHDPDAWHALVDRDSAGAIACTYGHEHHDDPRTVDDIFGRASAWYGGAQEISYPWQTHSALGPENQVKHEGYKWFVQRDLPCVPHGGTPGCIVAYRAQIHARGDISDQTTRFHSYSLEAVVQDAGGHRGIVRHGGHIDTGFSSILVSGGGTLLCPFGGARPDSLVCASGGPHRESSSINVPPPYAPHNVYLPNWYTQHRTTQVAVKIEEWGPIDPEDPTKQHFHPASARANNSRGLAGQPGVEIGNLQWIYRSDANRLINFTGYTDRHGNVVATGCTAPATDCVPLKIENARAVAYRSDPGVVKEYDVASPATGNSLIRYPN